MGKPLQANPGNQWFYSNVGFIVVARVIEKITGQAFEQAARQLLAEAGITRVQLGGNTLAEQLSGEAVNYLHPGITAADIVGEGNWCEPKPLRLRLPYAYPITTFDAAGGLVASAIDHARFLAAIDGQPSFPDILTPESVSAMASGKLGWDIVDGINPATGSATGIGIYGGLLALLFVALYTQPVAMRATPVLGGAAIRT